jgi:hypothetical protein
MWRAINNGKNAGVKSYMPSPMPVDDGVYLQFDNDEIAGVSALVVRVDARRDSVEDAIRAGEAFMNRPMAEKCATEAGAIDMLGNVLTPSRPVADRFF